MIKENIKKLSWSRFGIAMILALVGGIMLFAAESKNHNLMYMYGGVGCPGIDRFEFGTTEWRQAVQKCSEIQDSIRMPFSWGSRIVFWPFGVGVLAFESFPKVLPKILDNKVGDKLDKALYAHDERVRQRCRERYVERHRNDPDFNRWNEDIQEESAKSACSDASKNGFKVLVTLFVILPFLLILPGIISWIWLTLIIYAILMFARHIQRVVSTRKI